MMKQLIKNKRYEVIKALVEARKIKQEWLEDLYSILELNDDDKDLIELKKVIVEFMNDVKITIYAIPEDNFVLATITPVN